MKKQKLLVWWVPQVPMKAFEREVSSVTEALTLLNTLADYDLFQYENNVKGDYANMGGLNMWDEQDGEFISWAIEFNCTINGNSVYEYFDEPEDFVEFLKENNISEEELYNLINV